MTRARLNRSQIRQLERHVRDTKDRTRDLLVGVFTTRFALYDDESRDVYAMNHAAAATLFKCRSAAKAIRQLLSDRSP